MSFSPIDPVPIEVIQQIFLLCLPDDKITFLPPKKTYVIQLVISQVSSRWRSIALGTPQLWDNLILSLARDNNWRRLAKSASQLSSLLRRNSQLVGSTSGITSLWPRHAKVPALQLASLWLHRAGALPITLTVHTDLPHDDSYIQNLYSLLSSHRFKNLAGKLMHYWPILHNKSYQESFSTLDSLHLKLPIHSFQQSPTPADSNDYCQLPSLQHLHLNCAGRSQVSIERDLHMIPWHQLRTLTVYNVSDSSIMTEITRECKALVECFLIEIHSDANSVSVGASINPLSNLALKNGHPIVHLTKILSPLNISNLTSIHLSFIGEPEMDESCEIDWLPDAPFNQVQEFVLSNPSNVLRVKMFLEIMPSLCRLELHGNVSLYPDTLYLISAGQLGRCLNTISFHECYLDFDNMLDMVKTRQENAKSISIEGQKFSPFIYVRFACRLYYGNPATQHRIEERVQSLERQHRVRVQVDATYETPSYYGCWGSYWDEDY